MRTLPILVLALMAAQASAQDGGIKGRMSCIVTSAKTVLDVQSQPALQSYQQEDLFEGEVFMYEYSINSSDNLALSLKTASGAALFESEFSSKDGFKGVAPITGHLTFEENYNEMDFGRSYLNYKGSDRLLLKQFSQDCWRGSYVRTYAAGTMITVASLECHPEIDALDNVLEHLEALK